MATCLCLKSTGDQCLRSRSKKPGDNPLFCWQHQNCQKIVDNLTQTAEKQKAEKQKTEKQMAEKQKTEKQMAEKLKVEKQMAEKLKVEKQMTEKHRVEKQMAEKQMAEKQKAEKQMAKLHPSRQLVALSGPSMFAFYPNVHGKRILLLGEFHKIVSTCQSDICKAITVDKEECNVYDLHTWLGDLVKNGPECVDIFVEQSYLADPKKILPKKQLGGKPLELYSSPLSAIKDKFKNCRTTKAKMKEKCYADNLRYHFVDLRGYKGITKSALLYMYLHKSPQAVLYPSPVIYKKYTPKKLELFLYVMGLDRSSSTKQIYDNYLTDLASSVKMTVNLVENDKYIKMLWGSIDKELMKLDPTLDKTKFLKTILDLAMEKTNMAIILFTLPQDTYFLLRLFMKFDKSKLTRGPQGCRTDDYEVVKNAILHAGSYHTKFYKEFIQRYFGQLPDTNYYVPYTNQNQCLTFEKPFDFFS